MTIVLLAAALLAACSRAGETPQFHGDGWPENLSDWRLMKVEKGALVLSDGVRPYDLATPLFSDYALKLRTVTLPEGDAATYDETEAFNFPVGTIVSKTFYYPQAGAEWTGDVSYKDASLKGPTAIDGEMALDGLRLIETRLLVRRDNGWVAIPYLWDGDQKDARLARTGEIVKLTLHRPDGRAEPFNYLVPNQNQCAGCHGTNMNKRAISPIGLRARHLNKPSRFQPQVNQLADWSASGILKGAPIDSTAPRNAIWMDASASVEARARSYLDINCSHCHSNTGPADTSGLDLRPAIAFGPGAGLCKTPVAAGAGTGARAYDIVPRHPERSIFVYRMMTNEPGEMMPELGRAVSHEEGVRLIAEWIREMEGNCG